MEDSRYMAFKGFENLERHICRDPKLYAAYIEFMR